MIGKIGELYWVKPGYAMFLYDEPCCRYYERTILPSESPVVIIDLHHKKWIDPAGKYERVSFEVYTVKGKGYIISLYNRGEIPFQLTKL